MKTAFAILLLFVALVSGARAQEDAAGKKRYVLYAQFLQNTQVELSDGAVWMMEKGDCFPIDMFKEHQTKILLKIASTTFLVDATRMRVMPESENETALVSYRKNLADYLNGRPDAWKRDSLKKK